MGAIATIFLATLVSLSHAQPSPSLQRFESRKILMGVECRIVLYARDEAMAKRACAAAFDRITQLDAIMSDYRPDSELMQLCAKAHEAPVKVSDDLFVVLKTALEIAEASGGAFDITVGPFVALWRQARKTKQLPTEAELAAAREKVGWQKVQLDPKERTVRLLVAGMRLDLGGIAKGYAGDCALAVLRRFGITRAMVEFGGDIALGDPPPKRKGWRIVLPDATGKPRKVLELANCAIIRLSLRHALHHQPFRLPLFSLRRHLHPSQSRFAHHLVNLPTVSLANSNDRCVQPLHLLGKEGEATGDWRLATGQIFGCHEGVGDVASEGKAQFVG